jgi:uncharacterized protein YdeI (YjbR/CyaY-like superfamily)
MFCSMAAFKQHCAFGFWKASLVLDSNDNKSTEAMGHLGRITSVRDLPSRAKLLAYLRKAKQLNDDGATVERKARPHTEKRELKVPSDFLAAVKKNKKAQATFEGFSFSKKKEYVEWVTEAKTGETRARRLQTSVAWLAEGKARNWKYERC